MNDGSDDKAAFQALSRQPHPPLGRYLNLNKATKQPSLLSDREPANQMVTLFLALNEDRACALAKHP